MHATDTFYFAYGSNMGAVAFRDRCPRAVQVGIAKVEGYRIGFTRHSKKRGGGVADLVAMAGSVVWGAIFDISQDGFDVLDEAEGVRFGSYSRSIWKLAREDGSLVSAWTYVVVDKKPEIPPSYEYWKLLVDGAKEAGLPPEYAKRLEAIRYST
jgi:cation transport regulator ChaC